jgi:hypothetical protein
MIAGYAVAFIVMALYVASMYLRSRNLKQDMTILEEMDKSAESIQASSSRQPGKARQNSAKPRGSQSANVAARKTRKNY